MTSPPRLPAQEETWTAPLSPLCLVTTDSSCPAGGDTRADSPARRNRGYDGPTRRRSHDNVRRQRALRALARHDATSTRAIHPKKSAAVWSGQCRGVTSQDDMSKRPDVCRETNGPPTRHWSTATDVRAAGFLSGMRPPPPRLPGGTRSPHSGNGCWRKYVDASPPPSRTPTLSPTATTLLGNASISTGR